MKVALDSVPIRKGFDMDGLHAPFLHVRCVLVLVCLSGAGLIPAELRAQDLDAASPEPRFEVASIRPAPPPNGRFSPPRVRVLPGSQVQAVDAPVELLIRFAYQLEPYQRVEGVPKALSNSAFEIVAKAPAPTASKTAYSEAEIRAMMRALLADRFRLRAHFGEEQQRVATLHQDQPNKLGRGLRPLTAPCSTSKPLESTPETSPALQSARRLCGRLIQNGTLAGEFTSLAEFAQVISYFGERAVIDETGLTGAFEIEMTFNPTTWVAAASRGSQTTAYENLPSFSDAMRDELGLTLRQEVRTIQVFVVDHVEAPTAN